jgi:hypothetical protein
LNPVAGKDSKSGSHCPENIVIAWDSLVTH